MVRVRGCGCFRAILIPSHGGLVGSAIVRDLHRKGYENLLLRKRAELDLTTQAATDSFSGKKDPTMFFLPQPRLGEAQAGSITDLRP